LIDFHLLQVGEPFPVEDLTLAPGTDPGFGLFDRSRRHVPNGVQGGGRPGADALEFGGIEPDAATAAVTNVKDHAAGPFFAQRILARRTFHNRSRIKQVVLLGEFLVGSKSGQNRTVA
jgi:hypothetical protein